MPVSRRLHRIAAALALAVAPVALMAQPPPPTPVNCNESATGMLAGPDDRLRFEFPAARQTRVSVTAAPVPPPGPALRLTLLNGAGESLAAGDGALPETVLQDDGIYTVAVELAPLNGAPDGPIELTVSVACSAGPPNIPPPPPIPSPPSGRAGVGGDLPQSPTAAAAASSEG